MTDTTSSTRRPGPTAIRRPLVELLTLEDIADAMGCTAQTAAKHRQRPAPGGLPEPDAHVGRTPVWFRVTFERWQANRPRGGPGGCRPRGYSPKRAGSDEPAGEVAS